MKPRLYLGYCAIVGVAVGIYVGRLLAATCAPADPPALAPIPQTEPLPPPISNPFYEKYGYNFFVQRIDHHEYVIVRSSTGHIAFHHSPECPCLDEYVPGGNQLGDDGKKDSAK